MNYLLDKTADKCFDDENEEEITLNFITAGLWLGCSVLFSFREGKLSSDTRGSSRLPLSVERPV